MASKVTTMQVSDEAVKFINELLEKNDKKGFGVRIYMAGMGCSGPQFGMAFQEAKNEGDFENEMDGFSFYYDEETKDLLDEAIIDFVETPQGSGLVIQNTGMSGCSSCGGGCQ